MKIPGWVLFRTKKFSPETLISSFNVQLKLEKAILKSYLFSLCQDFIAKRVKAKVMCEFFTCHTRQCLFRNCPLRIL